jgi:PD-(D/E)XK endonuclease
MSRLKAEIACLKVELRAMELKAIVSTPRPEARYDRIIDLAGKLYRVQIKYCDCAGCGSAGSVQLNLRTHYNGKVSAESYSRSEVDAVLVYIPTLDRVLWLKPEVFVGKSTIYLRIKPTANNQKSGVRTAQDFIW